MSSHSSSSERGSPAAWRPMDPALPPAVPLPPPFPLTAPKRVQGSPITSGAPTPTAKPAPPVPVGEVRSPTSPMEREMTAPPTDACPDTRDPPPLPPLTPGTRPLSADSSQLASASKLRSTAPEYRPRASPPVVPRTPPVRPHAPHDYILVLDFEATCDEPQPPGFIPEIIEFPVVAVDVTQRCVVAEFHSFVRPVHAPTLSPFCTGLTGIKQAQVDRAPTLPEVVRRFERWLANTVPAGKTAIFATDGPWDLRDFMCRYAMRALGVHFPDLFYRWLDVKETFASYFGCRRGRIHAMLDFFGLQFDGRLHSGIDDARNIARIVLCLIERGCSFPVVDELDPESTTISPAARPTSSLNASVTSDAAQLFVLPPGNPASSGTPFEPGFYQAPGPFAGRPRDDSVSSVASGAAPWTPTDVAKRHGASQRSSPVVPAADDPANGIVVGHGPKLGAWAAQADAVHTGA